jgi:hypothetical protein
MKIYDSVALSKSERKVGLQAWMTKHRVGNKLMVGYQATPPVSVWMIPKHETFGRLRFTAVN